MNLDKAMDYARHADFNKESIVCLCKWQNNYCVFSLDYLQEESENWFGIEYLGSKLLDAYSVKGESYGGEVIQELTDDIIEYISPDNLNFQIYQTKVDTSLIVPAIYHQLLPDFILDYERVDDISFYRHQVDRTLNLINRPAN